MKSSGARCGNQGIYRCRCPRNAAEDTHTRCKDFKAKYLIADEVYDSKSIVEFAAKTGMKAVIPSRGNAKMQRNYDKELYKKRHIVEIFFLKIKKFMGISTRYTKNISSFQAYLTIASIMLYSNSI